MMDIYAILRRLRSENEEGTIVNCVETEVTSVIADKLFSDTFFFSLETVRLKTFKEGILF